jgi:hypothetical protein
MPYIIDGSDVTIGTEPFLHNDKNYVPLRDVVENLNGSVTFDNDTKTAVATIGPWAANVQMGATDITVDGNGGTTPVTLTAPAFVDNDEMFVPFDFFRDAFGYNVGFSDGTVTITNPNA